jgi:hypothetical protein
MNASAKRFCRMLQEGHEADLPPGNITALPVRRLPQQRVISPIWSPKMPWFGRENGGKPLPP